MQRSLTQSLRLATELLHAQVEQTLPIRQLIEARISRHAYSTLLRNLYEIYAELEAGLARSSSNACIAPVFFTSLFRANSLAADLVDLYGERWVDELAVMPATRKYVDRLREIGATRAELLVAHAYVRYLGDLSGGQILQRAVSSNHVLTGHRATFFDFGPPAAAHRMAQQFRAGLDAIGQTTPYSAAIVAEAEAAFALHAQLFEELTLYSAGGAADISRQPERP